MRGSTARIIFRTSELETFVRVTILRMREEYSVDGFGKLAIENGHLARCTDFACRITRAILELNIFWRPSEHTNRRLDEISLALCPR